MTPNPNPTKNPPIHKLNEIFCANLPSPCLYHLSHRINTAHKEPALIRFATKLHSVKLSTITPAVSRSPQCKTNTNYAVVFKRTPTCTAKVERRRAKHRHRECIVGTDDDDHSICTSHSSLTVCDREHTSNNPHSNLTIRVFAMNRLIETDQPQSPLEDGAARDSKGAQEDEADAKLCHDESTFHHYLTVTIHYSAKQEGDDGTNTSTQSKEDPLTADMKRNVHDQSLNPTRTIKSTRLKTRVEHIPLQFRPAVVHVAELLDTNADSVVGIFVSSSDDNTLRLYMAAQRSFSSWEEGDSNPSSRFEFMSPSFHDIGVEENGEKSGFTFGSLVTAMDSCTFISTQVSGNALAVACFDGTIRIMRYQLQYQLFPPQGSGANDATSNGRKVMLGRFQTSTFSVDGPIASLHFGRTLSPVTGLFLVVGSLCGFACLFYEVPYLQPITCGDNVQTATEIGDGTESECLWPRFEGPIVLVDGLHDPVHDDEDCVTAVHACCWQEAVSWIAVGTERGRLVLFRRMVDWDNSLDHVSLIRTGESIHRDEKGSVDMNLDTEVKNCLEGLIDAIIDQYQVKLTPVDCLKSAEVIEQTEVLNLKCCNNDEKGSVDLNSVNGCLDGLIDVIIEGDKVKHAPADCLNTAEAIENTKVLNIKCCNNDEEGSVDLNSVKESLKGLIDVIIEQEKVKHAPVDFQNDTAETIEHSEVLNLIYCNIDDEGSVDQNSVKGCLEGLIEAIIEQYNVKHAPVDCQNDTHEAIEDYGVEKEVKNCIDDMILRIGEKTRDEHITGSRDASMTSDSTDLNVEVFELTKDSHPVGANSLGRDGQNNFESIYDDTHQTSKTLRKIHRYELVGIHHLPYPIYAIWSVSGVERDVVVATRRTVHVLRETPSVGVIHELIALLETRLNSVMTTSAMAVDVSGNATELPHQRIG